MKQQTIISDTKNKKSNYIFPVIIVLLITFTLIFLMRINKPVVEEKDDVKAVPLVETVQIKAIDYVIPIISEGKVLPKTSINLSAEISGKIVHVSENFTLGGKFSKGEVLLQIDPVDYELAITRAKANVLAQIANLDLEQAKSDLAKDDWLKYGKKGKPTALNLNLPQVASSKAALSAAQAELELAQRNLEKTKIMAPFDGVIFTKQVDLGQFVNMTTPVARIASTEQAEIRVSLSDQQLQQSGITSKENQKVRIIVDEINDVEWQGVVTHIEAQRDTQTLLNYAIVSIQNPFNQQQIPLRFNSFVEVEFAGETLKNVYPVERIYMMLNDKLKILNSESKLEVRSVNVIYSDEKYFYVSDGLNEKDNLITTQLPSTKSGDLLSSVIANDDTGVGK